ncbi:MAG: hypothetical protein ACSLEM_01120 [Candidatus Malihini olakiniferum]
MADGNYMLESQNLNFNMEVVAVREAKEEEIAHCHYRVHVRGCDREHGSGSAVAIDSRFTSARIAIKLKNSRVLNMSMLSTFYYSIFY